MMTFCEYYFPHVTDQKWLGCFSHDLYSNRNNTTKSPLQFKDMRTEKNPKSYSHDILKLIEKLLIPCHQPVYL